MLNIQTLMAAEIEEREIQDTYRINIKENLELVPEGVVDVQTTLIEAISYNKQKKTLWKNTWFILISTNALLLLKIYLDYKHNKE